MPAAAVVAGVVGAVSTAGAAAAAVGALATAGTAALTVGSVASIATFVGSVATVVGAVTDNKKLLKVGTILGVAGGVTSTAANSLKLFGEGQTLSAAVNAANAASSASAANAAASASIAQSIPLGEFVAPKESFMEPLVGRSAGGLLSESALIPPSTTAQAAQQAAQATQAAQQASNQALDLAPVVEKSLPPVTENSFINTAGVLTPTVNAPSTPSVETPGFSFQKLSEFFTNPNNFIQLSALGAAASSYGKASMEEPLIEAQTNLYNTKADIARQNMYNSSAAGRLYGATK